MIPRYLRAQTHLGRGDLHPGGRDASDTLAEWMSPWHPGPLVEVGAGVGLTAERLRSSGWDVLPTEPDEAQHAALTRRFPGARRLRAEDVGGPARVVLGESVIYALDLPRLLPRFAETVGRGGALAFIDMVWTRMASPADAAALHDASLRAFGTPVASKERWTWDDWKQMLRAAGFAIRRERRLGDGSPGSPTRTGRVGLMSAIRHPASALEVRRRRGVPGTPIEWFESWCCLAVVESTPSATTT